MHQKPDMKIPALYGGVIIGLISSVPFLSFINCFCCAGILLGGFLGVFFYRKNFTPDTPPFTAGDCMVVGILAGVVGAVIESGFSVLFYALFGNVALDFLLNWLRNSNLQIPGDALDKIEESLRQGKTAVSFIINFFGALILNGVFGMLGGLIAYSVYKPKGAPMPPPPMPQPPMPPPVPPPPMVPPMEPPPPTPPAGSP